MQRAPSGCCKLRGVPPTVFALIVDFDGRSTTMRILYCRILIALLPCLALAQGVDIRGVVSDSSSGEHIPFANIILVGTRRGAA